MSRGYQPIDRILMVWILRLYPRRFVHNFGDEMLALYSQRRDSARESSRSVFGLSLFVMLALKEALWGVPLSWNDEWHRARVEPCCPGENWIGNLFQEAISAATACYGVESLVSAL